MIKWARREYLTREKVVCSKLKRGKLKTKKLLKILGILGEQESSVQEAEQVWSWRNMYLPVTITASTPENKYLVGSMRHKESQATISKSSHVQWSFIQQKPNLCLQSCSLDNTLNKPWHSAWESFNIRQKLGLFVLGVTHISTLPTVCIKLMWIDGWV